MDTNKNRILKILRARFGELKQFHVKSLSLFGSVARGESNDDSDVDLLVDFDAPIGLFDLFRLQHNLEALLGIEKVDLVMRNALEPAIRDKVLKEAVDV